ncbi:hypothetical protein ACUSIJ_12085 [Pseudochelatococcus sp. B33]
MSFSENRFVSDIGALYSAATPPPDDPKQQIATIVACLFALIEQAVHQRMEHKGWSDVSTAAADRPTQKQRTVTRTDLTTRTWSARPLPPLPGRSRIGMKSGPGQSVAPVVSPSTPPLTSRPGPRPASPAIPSASFDEAEHIELVLALNESANQTDLSTSIREWLGKSNSEFSSARKRELVVSLLKGDIKAPGGENKPYNWEKIAEICGDALDYPAGQGHGNVFYIKGTTFAVKRNLPNTELGVYRELDFYDRAVQAWKEASKQQQDPRAAVAALYEVEVQGTTFVKKELTQTEPAFEVSYTFGKGDTLKQDGAHAKLNRKLELYNEANAVIGDANKSKQEKIEYLQAFLADNHQELLSKFNKRLATWWRTKSGAMSYVVDRLREEARKAGVYRPNIPGKKRFLEVIEQLAKLRQDGSAAYRPAQVHEMTNGDAFVVMHNSLYDDQGNQINTYADYDTVKDKNGRRRLISHNLLDIKIGEQGASSGEQKYNAMAANTAQQAGLWQKLSNIFKKARVAKNHATTEDRQAAVVGKKGVLLDGEKLSSGGRSSATETRNIVTAYVRKMNAKQRQHVLDRLEKIIKEANVLPLGFIGSSVLITLPQDTTDDSTVMPGVMPIDYAHPVSQWDTDTKLTNDKVSSRTIPGMLHPDKFEGIRGNYTDGLVFIKSVFEQEILKANRVPRDGNTDSAPALDRIDSTR